MFKFFKLIKLKHFKLINVNNVILCKVFVYKFVILEFSKFDAITFVKFVLKFNPLKS